MLFVAFAIAITAALAFAVNGDIGSVFGFTQSETARAIPLVIIGTLLAAGLAGRHRFRDIVSGLVVWAAIGAVLMVGYAYRGELAHVGQRVFGALQPGVAMIDAETGNVHISRSIGGSFRVDTAVNGVKTEMIFDTGASSVVLTRKDAAAAGLPVDRLRYSVPVQTANGTGSAASVTIDQIEVGNIVRRQVRAFVVDDAALDTSLLGMSFLETLSRYSVSQDFLELHD